MYFFSNSPVKWRLTKVVCGYDCQSLLFSSIHPYLFSQSWWVGCSYLAGTAVTDEDELEGRDFGSHVAVVCGRKRRKWGGECFVRRSSRERGWGIVCVAKRRAVPASFQMRDNGVLGALGRSEGSIESSAASTAPCPRPTRPSRSSAILFTSSHSIIS